MLKQGRGRRRQFWEGELRISMTAPCLLARGSYISGLSITRITMIWSTTYTQMTSVTLYRSHRLSEYQFPDYQYAKLGDYSSFTRVCL